MSSFLSLSLRVTGRAAATEQATEATNADDAMVANERRAKRGRGGAGGKDDGAEQRRYYVEEGEKEDGDKPAPVASHTGDHTVLAHHVVNLCILLLLTSCG